MQTTKAKLDAALSISAKENSRYALQGVRITSDRINPDDPSEYKFINRIEATDAKILIRIDEISPSNGIPEEGLILTKDAIKSIPKGKRDSVDLLI